MSDLKLPATIEIGPISYAVKEVGDLHTVDGDNHKRWLHGHIRYAEAEIRIADDQADDVKVATLWHEALHGLLNNAGIDEHPESIVIALGYGLVRLLRDNPGLIAVTCPHPPAPSPMRAHECAQEMRAHKCAIEGETNTTDKRVSRG